MSVIQLPYQFSPRTYQRSMMEAMLRDDYKFACLIAHRRFGKDLLCWNICIAKALERVGLYFYCLPELEHARKVIWNGMDKSGRKFLDYIPRVLLAGEPNKKEMSLELKNGSRIQLVGANNYDRLVGNNPVGIVMSEYSLTNPQAIERFRPILAENDGWLLLNGTVRGKNHLYKVWQQSIQHPEQSFVKVLSTKDTGAISEDVIDTFRKQGMSEDTIRQEFYCDWDVGIQGAYYSEELSRAYSEERIRNFEINPGAPTWTFWDLGIRDAMAIWVLQRVEGQLRMSFYYENSGGGLKNAIEWLMNLREKHKMVCMGDYAPHDIMVREFSSGRTRLDQCRDYGINFKVVRRAKNVIEDITSTRNIFYRLHFHAHNCEQGLSAIQEYHAHYDEKTGWIGNPVHNWASHGADALRNFGIAWRELIEYGEEPKAFIRADWHP